MYLAVKTNKYNQHYFKNRESLRENLADNLEKVKHT